MSNMRRDQFEDISSHSKGYRDDFEDISSYSNEAAHRADQDFYRGKAPQRNPQRSSQNRAKAQRPNNQRRPAPTSQAERLKQKPNKKKRNNNDVYFDKNDISSSSNPPKGKSKKKMSKTKKILLIIISVFLALVLLMYGIFAGMMGKMERDDSVPHGGRKNPYIDESELYSSKDVKNILLVGVDARANETVSRSDTMMLISIDKKHDKIKITSFLRDSYVEIPEHGWNKLNASTSKGGIELLLNTLEYNFKVKIDNYMLVDFVAFEKLIDSIGGVNVEVKKKEADYLNRTWSRWSLTGNRLHFDYGDSVHLNGEEALMFCRIRKLDSDFYRTERQRRVISAVKDSVMGKPSQVISIANSVLPLITTDMSTGESTSLLLNILPSLKGLDIAQQSIPADGTWHSERKSCGDSLVFNISENTKILTDFIYMDVYEGNEETSK